jgi:UDP-glucose 4-epimerase
VASILVTGAGGFIGQRVVIAAGDAGHCVLPMVRNSLVVKVRNVIPHDLTMPLGKSLRLPPVDWIFHLAGAYAGASYEELRRTDLAMAHNLIDWGVANGVKNWVFASAAEVYGHVRGIASESTAVQPVIPYGRVKLMIERLLIENTKDIFNRRVVILRVAEAYGSQGRLIGELTARLKRGFCPWPGNGLVPVSFVHVDDVARAFLCAVQSASTGVSIYNVADDVPATWHDFLIRMAEHLNARSPAFLPTALIRLYAMGSTAAARIKRRNPILTRQALRLITTPKPLVSACLKQRLGFSPLYRTYSEGLKEALFGLPNHA